MLTATEIGFIRNIIQELTALADPSEYRREEVKEVLAMLKKIPPLETEVVLEINKKMLLEK